MRQSVIDSFRVVQGAFWHLYLVRRQSPPQTAGSRGMSIKLFAWALVTDVDSPLQPGQRAEG